MLLLSLSKNEYLKTWGAFWAVFLLLLLNVGYSVVIGPIGEHQLALFDWHDGQSHVVIPAGRFILSYACTWFISILLLFFFPRKIDSKSAAYLIICTALIVRLLLIPHPVSDDIYRYLWEGRMLASGVNPYLKPPCDTSLLIFARDDIYHSLINHPQLPAVYPPGVLYLFSAIVHICYHPLAVKILMIAFDMGALVLLLALLRHRGYRRRWAILYAFNPVVLYSFSGQAHLDAIQIFFILCVIFFYDRRKWFWMFLFAGWAVQIKYIAVIFLPFLLRKDNWRYCPVMFLSMVLPYLPFLIRGEFSTGSLLTFGTGFAFNGSLHGLFRVVFGSIAPATYACIAVAVAVLCFGYGYYHPELNKKFKDEPVSGFFFATGVLLLTMPTVHFWYLSWIAPFIALRFSVAWMLLCLSIGFYFVANGYLHHTGRWHLPLVYQLLEWLPVWVLIIFQGGRRVSAIRAPFDLSSPKTVSVLIPAYNEHEIIATCIDSVIGHEAVAETIVIDGGSNDRTRQAAIRAGARVIHHSMPAQAGGGRGGQIAAGVQAATGDVIVVLHADTLLQHKDIDAMLIILARQPFITGGAVGGTFDTTGWKFRVLEFLNDARAVFLGISFGDQVQFFRKKPVTFLNLYPNLPLMEDVELSLRLSKIGRQTYLFGCSSISSRKWRKFRWKRILLILSLFTRYLINRFIGVPDTAAMYRRYYSNK
ncbi:MAG: glycosyltransferase [Desulfobacteraceae bacterium]|nr:glycosyltransferase [Desulfobacteraceae bacterium]